MRKRNLCVMFGGLALFALASCGQSEEEDLDYVSLRINPEIEMLCDEDGKVVEANAINNDGEAVLENVTLEGMDVNEAAVEFTDEAIEQGFFDPKSGKDTVYVEVASENASDEEKIRETIDIDLTKYFTDNQIDGKAAKEEIKNLTGNASAWGQNRNEMVMINRLLEADPTLDIDVLVTKDFKELVNMLKEINSEMGKLTKEERKALRGKVETVKEKYSAEIKVKEKIDALITRLELATIDDELKTSLTIELEALKDSFDEKKYEAYEQEVEELLESYNVKDKVKKQK